MATSTVTVITGEGVDPFTKNAFTNRAKLRAFCGLLKSITAGGLLSRGTTRPTVRFGTATASATVTCAVVVNGNTVTINNKALTATQQNSRGTVACASVSVADTVTIAGVVFTAAAAENLATASFNQASTDTAAATSLVACINYQIAAGAAALRGVITAKSSAAIVTIRAVTAGTGGDAITLATSNNTRLAKSGTTLSGGAAIANDQFDFGGSDTETATSLAYCINNSTTAGIPGIVTATSAAAVVTVSAAVRGKIGNAITLASSGSTVAVSAARLAGGTDTVATF